MQWIDHHPLDLSPLPGVHPLVAAALLRRGITSPSKAGAFLESSLYTPTPGIALPGMEKAVDRILSALQSHQKIFVWGDFDVDGQTSTTILVQALRAMDALVDFHIPVRARESHGVNIPGLREAIDGGAQLILTCDTGISAHEAIEYARGRGVDVIVTDHHDLPGALPEAFVLINPKFLMKDHPLAALSGAGVAYKLAQVLLSQGENSIPDSALLDLAALGLISDLATLVDDTRYLAQIGIQALRETKRLGLLTLFDRAEVNQKALNESHIGFSIGPRLNAMGRLGDANPIIDFLLTSDKQKATVIAEQLEGYNAQRQLLTAQVTQAAEAQIQRDPAIAEASILVLEHPAWPAGVLGIAAARLVEKYHRPAIVIATPPGRPAHGSARSVETLNITAAITQLSGLMLNFGGHPMAAGFALAEENLPAFRRGIIKTVDEMWSAANEKESTLLIDAWLNLGEISFDLAAALEPIAPYGHGNPQLLLASRNLVLEKSQSLGRNGEHRKIIVKDGDGISQEVLWWNGGDVEPPQGAFDLAYTLRKSDWRGTPQLQMEFIDLKKTGNEQLEIKTKKRNIIDYRGETESSRLISEAKKQPSTLIWAEGPEKIRLGGTDRSGLSQVDLLLICAVPPSPEDLELVVKKVQPKTIWLMACPSPEDDFESFTNLLTSFIKYVLSHEGGEVSITRLAAATGQRLSTVRYGLDWLEACGFIETKQVSKDMISVKRGGSAKSPGQASILRKTLQSLLDETAAYRTYWIHADKDILFP